ncbi:low molecular weight protein-tyrosine-phosphatase [Candidatus Ruminimicrobium bovinum]|uniref:low molecular weight protein-tyrosine-phosphatase n=1 Tax=Candidatus Ruminimicrobium bovinum TaxID=3242779 RepID=UPI0039B883F8
MKKILFVCHGNICRSPMAEFIFKDMLKKKGLEKSFEVASAATSTEEIGNGVYPPARQILAEHGISCNGKTARQITKADYNYYDLIIGMDSANIYNMHRMWNDTDNKIKHILIDFTKINRDVADPWYTGDFKQSYDDLVLGCKAVLKKFIL